jgi:hypothetical protein
MRTSTRLPGNPVGCANLILAEGTASDDISLGFRHCRQHVGQRHPLIPILVAARWLVDDHLSFQIDLSDDTSNVIPERWHTTSN